MCVNYFNHTETNVEKPYKKLRMINYNKILKQAPRTHSTYYPPSYYIASANENLEFPALTENIRVDICVVGGGFSGVNTALELAERGYTVALLEARLIGWGASGRNGGQLLYGIGQGIERFRKVLNQEQMQLLYQMGFESTEIVKQRVQKYAIKCDLKLGSTNVAIKPRHIRELQEQMDWLKKQNYPYDITYYDKQHIQEVVGSECYIGALSLGGNAHLHPLNLCLGEVKVAEELGVKIYTNTPAVEITNSKPHRVKTPKGTVRCDFVVMCGNAYASNMHNEIKNKVLPAGSYIIATEPLSDKLAQEILPKDTAVCDLNYALDYYRLSADKRMLFGGLCNYLGTDPHNILATLKSKMQGVFPKLRDVKIDYQWGGMIGIGLNRMPQIGRVNPTMYYAQAYAGHGVNATHIAARVISESIAQQSERIDIFEKIPHYSFPGNSHLRSPLFALGMLFYKLKDLL